jgi:hypothetical protein
MEDPFPPVNIDEYVKGDAGHPVIEPTRVFRVEMPNGHGPFDCSTMEGMEVAYTICSTEPGFDCCANAALNHEHMDITDYAFHKAHDHADYACESIDGVKSWFHMPAREFLAKHGAKIVEYEIPVGGSIAVIGHDEVIFNRFEATPVARYDIVKGEKIG